MPRGIFQNRAGRGGVPRRVFNNTRHSGSIGKQISLYPYGIPQLGRPEHDAVPLNDDGLFPEFVTLTVYACALPAALVTLGVFGETMGFV